MSNLRRWQLGAADPYTLRLAADARLSQTRYADDQSWEIRMGRSAEDAALSLYSTYGGRVESALLTLRWLLDSAEFSSLSQLADAPVITAFAPAYARIEAALTATFSIQAEFWVMESQALGCRLTCVNSGTDAVNLRTELIAGLRFSGRRMPQAILMLAGDAHALSVGRIPGFEPVLLMDGGASELRGVKDTSLGANLRIGPGARASLRWVHAGLKSRADSVARAQFWLVQDWDSAFAQIEQAAEALPSFETDNSDHDATIAFSVQQLMQSLIGPTEHLPAESIVAMRQPTHGFSRKGDGSDYRRGWNGQNPYLALLAAQSLAGIAPDVAGGMLRNALASQAEDGFVDFEPGLGGQRSELLCAPVLARMAWAVYEQTGDRAFLAAVYTPLLDFFNRWAASDLDADRDITPEWQDVRQTGYIFWPTFASGQTWSHGVNIRYTENPDLVAYLLSEAEALKAIAEVLKDRGAFELQGRIAELLRLLERMWQDDQGRYVYRDRDSEQTSSGTVIVADLRGDEEGIAAIKLDPPARVIVRLTGGTNRPPTATLHIEGQDAQGNKLHEQVAVSEFGWYYNQGEHNSAAIFSRVDRVRFEGLSRVFRFSAHTPDLRAEDLNHLLPLIAQSLPAARVKALVKRLGSERFLRPAGLSLVPADDPAYDSSSANGGGGTWVFWSALLAEALMAHGAHKLAAEVLHRLLNTQSQVLREEKQFREFYDSDQGRGLGDAGHLAGIVPVGTLGRVWGVRILGPGRVQVGGPFVWPATVRVRQHGIEVMRSARGSQITFASGEVVKLPAKADWQIVTDPAGTPATPIVSKMPAAPDPTTASSPNRIIIDVQDEDDPEGTA